MAKNVGTDNVDVAKRRIYIAIVVSAILSGALFFGIGRITANHARMHEAYSYIIYKEDSNYYAKNGTTRSVEFGPSTNVTSVYEDARDALASLGGGTILFRAGTYVLPAVLVPESNVNIKGEGWSTVLQAQDSQREFYDCSGCIRSDGTYQESNYTIQDLKVVGNILGQADQVNNNGILLINATNVVVRNVYAENSTTGFLLRTNIHGFLVDGCYSTNNERYGFALGTRAKNCTITNSYSWDNGYDGFSIDEDNQDCSITNCFSAYNRHGIQTQATAIDLANIGLTIAGNTLVNNTSDGLNIKYTNYSSFKDNTIKDNGSDGIEIASSTYPSHALSITGNIIVSNDDFGMDIGGLNNSTISDNIVANNGDTGSTEYGIKLNDCSYNVVNDNRCFDDQTTRTQRWGIYEQGTSDYNMMVGDHCLDNWIGGISIVGANTEVHSCFNGTTWIT